MNELTAKEQHWPGLIVGGVMALIPSFDRFSELGESPVIGLFNLDGAYLL